MLLFLIFQKSEIWQMVTRYRIGRFPSHLVWQSMFIIKSYNFKLKVDNPTTIAIFVSDLLFYTFYFEFSYSGGKYVEIFLYCFSRILKFGCFWKKNVFGTILEKDWGNAWKLESFQRCVLSWQNLCKNTFLSKSVPSWFVFWLCLHNKCLGFRYLWYEKYKSTDLYIWICNLLSSRPIRK